MCETVRLHSQRIGPRQEVLRPLELLAPREHLQRRVQVVHIGSKTFAQGSFPDVHSNVGLSIVAALVQENRESGVADGLRATLLAAQDRPGVVHSNRLLHVLLSQW
jgi:hypothetical protein